jgi:DNA-binding transcriptional LysR family regulator
MDLKLWELFVLLAEHRHFGRAARAAGLTQPALSGHIGRLERATGCRLFVRTTRSVELSSAGELLLPRVQRLLRDLRALSNAGTRFERRLERRLRLGLPAHFGAAAADEVARRFERDHREDWVVERVRLGARDLGDALSEGDLDLALMHVPPAAADLACSPPVVVEPRGVVLPAGHRLADRSTLRSPDLADLPLLALDADAFGPMGPVPPTTLPADGPGTVTNVEEFLDALALGHGVGIAPMSDAARLRAHGLAHVPLLDVDAVVLAFVWHRAMGTPVPEAALTGAGSRSSLTVVATPAPWSAADPVAG